MTFEGLTQDLRFAWRGLRRDRGFASAAIVSLGVGIGANVAVFSAANAVLFRPVPGVNRPDQLVLLGRSAHGGSDFSTFSYPDYADCRDQTAAFSALAAYRETPVYFRRNDSTQRLSGMLVSGSYFQTIGVTAAVGRVIVAEDDGAPGTNPVAVISHALWQRSFDADPNVVGKTITLNRTIFTIVGVLRNAFAGMEIGDTIDVWLPLSMYAHANPLFVEERLVARHITWLSVVGRLAGGVTPAQGQAEMDLFAERLAQQHPATNKGLGITVAQNVNLDPLRRSEARTTTGILLGITGLVLLITCANVANLLLVRGAVRRREFSIRQAVGASRGRLSRQLLVEALLISGLGGALGAALAFSSRAFLVNSSFLTGIRLTARDLQFDARVLAFILLASILTALVFGLIPTLGASRGDVDVTLRSRGIAGVQRGRARKALVTTQVATSVVVLIAAGLFVRTLQRVQSIDPGFDVRSLLALPIDFGRSGYSDDHAQVLYQQLVRQVRGLPGVAAASLGVTVPLSGSWRTGYSVEGRVSPGPGPQSDFNIVAPDYFRTAGIVLVSGRDFNDSDSPESPRVVIVSQEFARRIFPDENPLGKRLHIPRTPDDKSYAEIVGIVADIKYERLTDPPRTYFYLPLAQHHQSSATLFARVHGTVEAELAGSVAQELQRFDNNVPGFEARPVAERVQLSLAPRRSAARLLAVFGILALTLASVGLYSVVAYSVAQRRNEIGLRMAIGATVGDVVRLVLREGALMAVCGIVVGVFTAVAATELLEAHLFGVSSTDPLTYGSVAATLLLTALVASLIPARHAARIDPLVTLRSE